MEKHPQSLSPDSDQVALRIGSIDDGPEVDRILDVLAVSGHGKRVRWARPVESTNALLLFFERRPLSTRQPPTLHDRLDAAAIFLASIDLGKLAAVSESGVSVDLVVRAPVDRWVEPSETLVSECRRLALEIAYIDPQVTRDSGGRMHMISKTLCWPQSE